MWLLGVLKHKNPNILLALDFNTDYSYANIYGHIFTPVNALSIVLSIYVIWFNSLCLYSVRAKWAVS